MCFVLKQIKKETFNCTKNYSAFPEKSIPSRFSAKHIELLCISQRALLKRLA